jgi:hypothetical protein
MISTTANALTAAAGQYQSITGDQQEWVKIYLLAQLAGAPWNTMTAQQLIAAAQAYQQITGVTAKQVQIVLLAQAV